MTLGTLGAPASFPSRVVSSFESNRDRSAWLGRQSR